MCIRDSSQRFEDLRIQSSTQQDKLKQTNQQVINLENMLQTTRLQLERERQNREET